MPESAVLLQKLMNEEEMQQWILRRLGGLVHEVELTEDHLADAVEAARRWFAAKKGIRRLFTVQGYPSIVEYDLDADIDIVIDVAFASTSSDGSLYLSPFPLLEESLSGIPVEYAGMGAGNYSGYIQMLQYGEMMRRFTGAELEWRQIDRKLLISPVPSALRVMIVEAKVHQVRLDWLTERDHDLVKRYALMHARMDLATIRGKFDSFPTAQGSVNLDSERLMDMARTELERLEEEIFASAGPSGFLTG